jgi:hypothetical protein
MMATWYTAMAYAPPKDSSSLSPADVAELLQLIEEDRVESPRPPAKETPMTDNPAFAILLKQRWNDAFRWLLDKSLPLIGAETANSLSMLVGDRRLILEEIPEIIDSLYAIGTIAAGELALAWSTLTCSPRNPVTFRSVLPQLQASLDHADLDSDHDIDLRDRLRIWWRAARGDFAEAEQQLSMHSLAETTLKAGSIMEVAQDLPSPPSLAEAVTANWFSTPHTGPTMIVMPKAGTSKLNNYNKQFEVILDQELPLVVARNLADAQKRLGHEFPHATAALQALVRDLREGQPLKVRATILCGPAGAGKSRIVRKIAAAVGWQHVQRYQADASADGQFAGTSKGWSNTEASVPARAVLASKTANPLIFIDEIDKAATNHHGSLWTSLLGFLESETARNYRDQSLDAELDLSMCSYLCTANDVSGLPGHLRDRFRVVKVPSARLVDLPLLAGSIVDDMLIEDEFAGFAAPFAPDELAVMAKAWQSRGMSMRALQKIVRATLEARDAHAMRH